MYSKLITIVIFFIISGNLVFSIDDKYSLQVNIDNDAFSIGKNYDRYYTYGTELSLTFPKSKTPEFFLNDFLFSLDKNEENYSISLTHKLFTPSDISSDTILNHDRPYAGLFYLALSKSSNNFLLRQKLLSHLSIGFIGKYAFGKELQTFLHRQWFKSPIPKGWDNQLAADIVLNFYNRFENAIFYDFLPEFINTSVLFDFNAGTLVNEFGLGANFKIGRFYDLKLGKDKKTSIAYYVYFDSFVRFVIYNSLLQGGIFNKSSVHSISADNINRFYFNGEYGLKINVYDIELIYSNSIRTSEFKDAKNTFWGSVKLKIYF
jgi:hypothetical protein